MRIRPFRPLLALVALLAFASLIHAPSAHADFHLMKVVEVFGGTPAAPNAKYVVLQMYAANQGNLVNHKVTIFNASGTLVDTFTFGPQGPNSHPMQSKVFIATPEAVAFFNLPADLTMDADMLASGGKACFDAIPLDCVAWGNYTGSATGVGTPYAASTGIPGGRAATRRLNVAGSPTALEAADDTDQCSTDFVDALPAPRNLAGTNGTIPAATCGNGALQGLEQCDDGNLANGDSCSSTCQVTIPSITLSIADEAVSEGNAGTKLQTFTITLSSASASAVTYDIATSTGTALASDYTPRSLVGETIPAGQLSKTFAVTILGDTTVESNETYAVTVSNASGAAIGDGVAVGTITNDDTPALTIFDASIAEGNAGTKALSFQVRLDKASNVPVTFDVATSNDTATAGSDYVAAALTNQSVPAGALAKFVNVTLNGDAVVEQNEKFNFTVANVANATVADGLAVGTIINDDGPTLSVADITKVEGNSGTQVYNFVVRLSQAATGPVTFNVQTVAKTAAAGSDFVAKTQVARTIPTGQLTFPFDVTVNGDAAIEPNEEFIVLVNAVSGPITVADDRASGFIVNDEGPVLTIADVSATEGNSGTKELTFTVTLSQAVGVPVSMSLSTLNFTAVAGSDFVQKVLHNQVIPAGMLSKTFTVTVNGDATVEANEQFVVLVSNTTGASAFDDRAFGNVVNDDGPVLSVGDLSLTEGQSGTKIMNFVVRLLPAAAGPVTYNVTTLDGSATGAGNDYTPRTLTGETIAAGATARAFAVTLKGDATVEDNESFSVRLSAPTGATIADDTAIGTLVNDDGPTLSIGDVSIAEGNAGTKVLTFTVALSQAAAGPVTYDIATSNGTATAGSDYVAKSAPGETIAAGVLSKAFAVTLNGDTTVEPSETFVVTLSGATGASIADAQATGTILNDDSPSLSIADISVAEGQAGTKNFTFTVQLSQVPVAPVTYSIATINGTATWPADYAQKSLVGETIPAGVTSRAFTVSVVGDTTSEGDEHFSVSATAVTGATVADGAGIATVQDDDALPPTISIGDAQVDEGHSGTRQMLFNVNLSYAAATDVTYSIATANGTANSPGDYAARSLTGETIPAGQTTKSFAVTVNGDVAVEGDEVMLVDLSAVTGATILDGQGEGEITNDDIVDPYSVSAIQGRDPESKLVGRDVETEGVVTALVAGGFFLQQVPGDGDEATSDGVFVTGVAGTSPSVGDRVQVRGRVEEARIGDDVAQLTQTRVVARAATVLAQGVALPAPVPPQASAWQPGAAATALERYEGMRVALPAMTVVAPGGADLRAGDGRFHVVAAGVPRPFLEPGLSVLDPRRAAGKLPPRFDANAEVLRIASDGQRGARKVAVDAGDKVDGLVGVLDYGAGRYALLPDPRAAIAVRAGATPGAVPVPAGGETTLARLDLGDYLAGASRNARDYKPRLAKAAHVLCRWLLAPAVVALPGARDAAVLADLAAQASAPAAGCAVDPRYRAHVPKAGGVGMLLSEARVASGAPRAALLAADPFAAANRIVAPDGTSLPLFAPPPQRWRLRLHAADGTPFALTALVVQFTALDDQPAAAGPHGWATRGDALRAQRRAQAALLATVVQARQQAAPDEALVVLGGFEAPQFSGGDDHLLGIVTGRAVAPDRVLHAVASPVSPPLWNLTAALPPAQRYTTTVAGDAQALDHVLVGAGLLRAYAPRVRVARINADFGADNAGDALVPLRVSARDPMVLYLLSRGR